MLLRFVFRFRWEVLEKYAARTMTEADVERLDNAFRRMRKDWESRGVGGLFEILGLFPEEGIGFALLLGAILAPTDAALGKAVVTNPSVPAKIRESLNVESGLNDGICVPVLLVFLAGLALNLTPCIYPLIPITVGFFSQQAKDRTGGTFGLAVVYVLGISVTCSVVGVVALR